MNVTKTKIPGNEKRHPLGRHIGSTLLMAAATAALYFLTCPGLHETIRKDRVVVLEQTSAIHMDSTVVPGKNGAPDSLKVTATAICPQNAHEDCKCDSGYVNKAKPGEPVECVKKQPKPPKPPPTPRVDTTKVTIVSDCDNINITALRSSTWGHGIMMELDDKIGSKANPLRDLLLGADASDASKVPIVVIKLTVDGINAKVIAQQVSLAGDFNTKIDIVDQTSLYLVGRNVCALQGVTQCIWTITYSIGRPGM